MKSVPVEEIFSSVQGEGPWVGQRHIFVRFKGCDIRCRYCDTPAAASQGNTISAADNACRVQLSASSLSREQVACFLSTEQLTEYCSRLVIPGPSLPILSLTGGEPLIHREFLLHWLPVLRGRFAIYLETNGIRHEDMGALRALVDIISMDFKLPSATGLKPFWEEHRQFLMAAAGRSLFVKAVVTGDTVRDDILVSARIIAESDGSIPLILQPASGPLAPGPALLVEFQNSALSLLQDVRVIPQAHKILSLP